MADYIFKESQRFNQLLIWIPIGTVTLFIIGLGLLFT
jgi:hypothetical protein